MLVEHIAVDTKAAADLLERLVINKAGRILGYFELTLLDLLSELPIKGFSTPYEYSKSADSTASID